MSRIAQPKSYKRTIGNRGPIKPIFLIVCEGEKTEPLYFESFRVSTVQVRVVGAGANTKSLVEKAKKLKIKLKLTKADQVWCVFDRDSFPTGHFKEAIQLAKKYGFNVAYSNEAFELWYLLHFSYHCAALSRSVYEEKLSKNLGFRYTKSNTEMYSLLLQKQSVAVENAKKLLASYTAHEPADDNPCTTVHVLVELLNRYLS